jgi:thiamine-monophosphate kinase
LSTLSEEGVIRAIVRGGVARPDIALGPGDDGAVLAPDPGRAMVFAMDTINEGVHFPAGIDPAAIGHRALAVNLSDLAAMGAEPAWASLSLSITEPQADWVEAFSRGLQSLAARHGVALVGGDTVAGPPSVSLHLAGFVEAGMHLTRAGARPGDRVYVTGCLGEAALGLRRWSAGDKGDAAVERFLWPEPRVTEGRDLVGIATACIDVSDGLATDLGRIAQASGVHVVVDLDALPLGESMSGRVPDEAARRLALSGGDDYELCFTVPEHGEATLLEVAAQWSCRVTRIGQVTKGAGLSFRLAGRNVSPDLTDAWSHFGDDPT